MKSAIYIIIVLLFFSCANSEKKKLAEIVSYWQNYHVVFPSDTSFVSYNKKSGEQKVSLHKGEYIILNYVDSTGCMSCKLQLHKWSEFIHEVDSISNGTIPLIFAFQTNAKNDLIHFLRKSGFTYPVYIDEGGNFDKLNNFSSEMDFHTFLLNRDSKVLAIGNPIDNPKVKDLYLKIIRGEKIEQTNESQMIKTKVDLDSTAIPLGYFNWQEEQKTSFVIKNTGSKPLVIQDVITSCGCTTVSYSQEPVQPGKEIKLEIAYKADHPEHFNKTITVYCNVASSPIKLTISGNAQ